MCVQRARTVVTFQCHGFSFCRDGILRYGGRGTNPGGGGGAAHKLDMHSLSGPPLAVGLLIAACDMKPAEDSVPEKLELWQQAIMSFRSLQKTKVARTVNASKRLEQNMEHIAAIVSLVSHLCR